MRRKDSGFTLIELLVVIAIIAILASILFPVFISAKAKARQAKCIGNLRQIGSAVDLYSQDWAGHLPLCQTFGKYWTVALGNTTDITKEPHPTRSDGMYLPELLYPYIKEKNHTKAGGSIFMCPSVSPNEVVNQIASGFTPRMNGDVTYLWIHIPGDIKKISGSPCPGFHWYDAASGRYKLVSGRSTSDAKMLSRAPMVIDIPYWGESSARHNGGINVLYGDCHVKWTRCGPGNTDFYYYGDGSSNWQDGSSRGWETL